MKREFLGVGSTNILRDIIRYHDARNIFLVTGKNSFYCSGARDIIVPILSDKHYVRFCDFSENPQIEDIIKGVSIFERGGYDAIVAVGGGSVIDIAKIINIVAHQRSNKLENIIKGKEKITSKGVPLVAIPTTSGSGSEATHFAVVYIDETKYSLDHEYILPDYSIVDPSLTYDMPPQIAAISGMDALSQAVESYWSINSTGESRECASQAIKMILSALEPAVCRMEKNARDTMSIAAHIAGKAINITKTSAPHAISYPITIYFGVPHGHAVALTIGKFFMVNSTLDNVLLNDSRGKDYLVKALNELYALFDCENAQACSDKWYKLMTTVGLQSDFNALGIESHDVDRIIKKVNIERLNNNPVKINEKMLRHLFD